MQPFLGLSYSSDKLMLQCFNCGGDSNIYIRRGDPNREIHDGPFNLNRHLGMAEKTVGHTDIVVNA